MSRIALSRFVPALLLLAVFACAIPFSVNAAVTVYETKNKRDYYYVVMADMMANGGFNETAAHGYPQYPTSQPSPTGKRICYLYDPTAYPTKWSLGGFDSPGNNKMAAWNPSIGKWYRQSANSFGNKRYNYITCKTDAAPDASLTASKTEIVKGGSATLTWLSRYAQIRQGTCSATNFDVTITVPGHFETVMLAPSGCGGDPFDDSTLQLAGAGCGPGQGVGLFDRWVPEQTLSQPFGGSRSVSPTETTTYTYTCTNANGSNSESVTIVVKGSDESCTDGEDNDNDGLTDADDPDCANGGAGTEVPVSNLPDLTASPVTPVFAGVGVSTLFSSAIKNNGAATAGSTFTNLFQFDNDTDHTTVDATRTDTSAPLFGGATDISQVTFTFPTKGTWYVRACADNDASWKGVVTESNEDNNCSNGSDWLSVTVGDPTECSDGKDNDGDKAIDLSDPGCLFAEDNDEVDPPQCSDQRDNDKDELVDMNDPGCKDAEDNDEYHPIPELTLKAVNTAVQPGKSTSIAWGAKNVEEGSCTLSGTNGDSWELSDEGGVETTSAINERTTYTLACKNVAGQTVSKSVTIQKLPVFNEQ